jgi:hypothetical protein
MKSFIPAIILSIFFINLAILQELDENCEEKFKTFPNRSDCCVHPYLSLGKIAEKCMELFVNESDPCPPNDCIMDNMKMFENKKLSVANLAEWFLSGLDDAQAPRGKWPEIVKNVVSKCIEVGE